MLQTCRSSLSDLFINGFGIFTASAGAKIAWWIEFVPCFAVVGRRLAALPAPSSFPS